MIIWNLHSVLNSSLFCRISWVNCNNNSNISVLLHCRWERLTLNRFRFFHYYTADFISTAVTTFSSFIGTFKCIVWNNAKYYQWWFTVHLKLLRQRLVFLHIFQTSVNRRRIMKLYNRLNSHLCGNFDSSTP